MASNNRAIHTVKDIDEKMKGLKMGTLSHKVSNGKSHVHVPIIPEDKDVKSPEICTLVTLARTNPMRFVAALHELRDKGLLTEEEFKKYGDHKMEGNKYFSSSPLILLPGQSDGFTLKIHMGDATPEGSASYDKTAHSIAFSDIVMEMYRRVCDMVDANKALKLDILSKSGVPGNKLESKASEPAKDWIDPPVVFPYYKDAKEVNGVMKSKIDKIENEPGVFSLKPIIVPFAPDKKLSEGSFTFDSKGSKTTDPNMEPDSIWYTRWEYVKNRKLISAQCIEEVATDMYISEENRKKGAKLDVPKQSLFELAVDFTCQLPTLYVNEGKGHLIFKTFKVTRIGKTFTQKVRVDPAAVSFYEEMAAAFEDEQEHKDDGEMHDLSTTSTTATKAASGLAVDPNYDPSSDPSLLGEAPEAQPQKPKIATNPVSVFAKRVTSDAVTEENSEEGSKKRKDHPTSGDKQQSKKARK